ncbi:peptidase M14 carboxypeptidase A [Lacinutrix sp. 5H-3-7-4]|nr:peptidase M14 carboxypeptidase A [Lacinutrix sp. 5H-3-7-4]
MVTFSFSQEKHSRIKINHPDQHTANTVASQGIDLNCGAKHEGGAISLDLSAKEINKLRANNISFTVEIDDLQKFYSEKAKRDLPKAKAELKNAQSRAAAQSNNYKSSISNIVTNNIIQYTGCDEIDFVEPQNFNLGNWAGCLTYREVQNELDDMYTYSQTNSLDIVSVKANASSTGQKTWGNPANTITNNGLTYSGQGTASSFENEDDRDGKTFWQPETIYYIRITGDQSSTPEGSKPQILFTSMIHSREVSALMNNMYFMWYLVENYDTDPAIKELVDNNELYFVPVVNPDGLKWNEHLDARQDGLVDDGSYFQRKNLRPNTGGTGNTSENRGVDLNRNFDYYWGLNDIGSSGLSTNNGANGTYRGPAPESEPETQIMVDFITTRNIKSAVWNHSYANSVPHPYGGEPTDSSGREDEFYRWHEEMTRYNRYLYGATIFYESNGIPDDWMMGGDVDNNGSTGSGQAIIATTPEHGGEGFWPTPSTIIPIAKRSMRISLATAYYGGKYAKLHDLTQSNLTNLTENIEFGIERIGQTASDFTVTVTPVSSNITSISSPVTETGMPVLSQRTVSFSLNLDPSITTNQEIQYNVKLSNDDGIIYEANYKKYYQPTLLFDHDPDATGLTGWTQSNGWINTTSDAYSGSNAISTGTYNNNVTKTLTTTNSYDFTNSEEVLIQFYSKWDIERNYDFVEVLGSPDGGSSWVSLCGNYTKPNATSATTSHDNKSSSYANFQANSSGQVYDGDRMDNWVMEEFTIDASNYASLINSNNVKIRFNFRTDALNVNENYSTTNDGFFIDDFKIISVNVACQTTVPTNITFSNISAFSAQVDWFEVSSATYDLRYRETGSGASGWTTVTNLTTNSYTITGLSAETEYDVRVRTRCETNTSSYSTIENFTTPASVPCTGSAVSSFPYSESFEADFGLWTNNTSGDDIDWTRNSGTTPTNTTNNPDITGPSGASDGTFYIYTEASGEGTGYPNKVAYITSPCFELDGYENSQFSFDYHMFGATMGNLYVEVSTDNFATFNTVFTQIGQPNSQTTANSNPWLTETVDLSAYNGQTIKLRFHGITGSSFRSDISVDNINFTADVATSAPPVASCQNITVQLDNTGNATIIATDVDNGSTDDVAITNYSIDIDTFDCSNIGTPVNVTLTVTDAESQTDSCTATVTVVDQVNPEFVNVPGDQSFTCGNNNPTWTDPTATDNCDTTLTVVRTDSTGLNSGDTFPNGTTTISYSVTDDSGNTETASFNVNIIADSENPTAVCQNISIQLDNTGNATITASQINNGSSDNCGIASISASKTSFTCTDEGTNNVILTVTDANGNSDTCTAVVTVTLQDEPAAVNCWDNYTYNYTSCSWENQGTQPTEPTATNCWDDYQFDTTSCSWVNQGSQPTEPTATNCWDDYQFDTTSCTWVNQGSQPTEPTATNCWDDYQFDTTSCTWVNQGSQPTEPTATNCWDDYQFDTTSCSWVNQGSQPTEPTATNCWDDYQFDTTSCSWVNQGSQPTEPTATNCWDDYQFDTTSCTWVNQGSQPTEPTATNCWDDYQFDTTSCSWVNQGSQPTEPTATNCWDDYQFDTTSCSWVNQGSQPTEPTATNCWDDYQFDTTSCTWVNQGSQPTEPTATNCWDDYQFDTTSCSWVNQGSQPTEPTATNCWDDYQFDTTSCTWVNQGSQPTEPTATNCWDDYQFDTTSCSWVNQGSQPTEPTATNCWDDYQFDTTSCSWVNQGSQPTEPTATNCWDDYQFDTTSCSWVNQGSQPTEPATECYETATFNNNTCMWEVEATSSTTSYYADTDGDGFGDENNSVDDCSQPAGYVNNNTDCDDTNSNINPDATEIPQNGIDEDCNGTDETTLGTDTFITEEINISPNPFRSNINIALPLNFSNEKLTVIIYDLNGRIIHKQIGKPNSSGKLIVTGLEQLDQAPYFLRISNSRNSILHTQKLIKF